MFEHLLQAGRSYATFFNMGTNCQFLTIPPPPHPLKYTINMLRDENRICINSYFTPTTRDLFYFFTFSVGVFAVPVSLSAFGRVSV